MIRNILCALICCTTWLFAEQQISNDSAESIEQVLKKHRELNTPIPRSEWAKVSSILRQQKKEYKETYQYLRGLKKGNVLVMFKDNESSQASAQIFWVMIKTAQDFYRFHRSLEIYFTFSDDYYADEFYISHCVDTQPLLSSQVASQIKAIKFLEKTLKKDMSLEIKLEHIDVANGINKIFLHASELHKTSIEAHALWERWLEGHKK